MAMLGCDCEDGVDEGQPLTWTYVGEGRGDWAEAKKLEFVGHGKGAFIQEEVRKPWGWRTYCVGACCCFILLLVPLIFLLYFLLRGAVGHSAANPVTLSCFLPTQGPAAAGAAIIQESWTALDIDADGLISTSSLQLWQSQKLFSSQTVGLLNSTSAVGGMIDNGLYVQTLIGTMPENADQQHWIQGAWLLCDKNMDGRVTKTEMGFLQRPGSLRGSIDEQLWQGDSDDDGTLTRAEFEQGLGLVAAHADSAILTLFHEIQTKYWLESRKEFCCGSQGICPVLMPAHTTATTTVGQSYNCHLGEDKQDSWPEMKRAWCCSRFRVGCFSNPSVLFDCNAGWQKWQTGWSEHKKAWCCFHLGRGCSAQNHFHPSDWQAHQHIHYEGAEHHFDHVHIADPTHWHDHPDAAFGDVSSVHWHDHPEEVWHHAGTWHTHGYVPYADHVHHVHVYDTHPDHIHYEHVHVVDDLAQSYDCQAGLANWKAGWSSGKRTWCCSHEGKGCDPNAFDCSAGLSNWHHGWSNSKKTWCCANENKGCA
ncbi:unnamed protein product [Effrenium voratum]|nr:unnamed protein product [Effrenium voratum]